MKQLICDRCGEPFEPIPDWAQAPAWEYKCVNLSPFGVWYIDLCRDCQKEFDRWLKEKKAKKEENT